MLERMTNEQLLDEIDRLLAEGSAQENDTARLGACLALLQQRSPVMEDYDAHQAKVRLQTEHPHLFARANGRPKKRFLRRRLLPLAAALTALLVICVGAHGLTNGWSFRYEANQDDIADGDRYAVTSVDYGGTQLPYESRLKIYDTMVLEEVVGGSRYVAEFAFDSLAELETFVGVDLVESDQLAVNDVHCTAYIHNETAQQTVSIDGFYTLVSDDYACRVRFHFSTYPEARLSRYHLADETAYNFKEYPLDKLDFNAAILSSTTDKKDISAYWTKDRLAYELSVFGEKDDLKHLKAALDSLQ